MSKKVQIQKNLQLSSKVAQYILDHPEVLNNIPEYSSYVVFSNDIPLNKANDKLVKSLQNEGKSVIKVVMTDNSKSPWQFILL